MRAILFSDTLFTYRDVLWSDYPNWLMNVFYIIDFESSRRIIFLGRLFLVASHLGLSTVDVQHFLFFITRFMTGFLTYTNKFLSSKSMTFNRKPYSLHLCLQVFSILTIQFHPILRIGESRPTGLTNNNLIVADILIY